MLVAMNMEDMLLDLGHEVAGIASRLAPAMSLIAECEFDFALLDVNLAGEPSFPVASALRERGIPFLFATGYGARGLSDEFRTSPVLQKPFAEAELGRAIEAVID